MSQRRHALLLALLPFGIAGLVTGRGAPSAAEGAGGVPEVILASGARVLGRPLPAVGQPREDDVFAYFGLRYAEAKRFQAPELYEAPAHSVLNATEVNAPCMQRFGDEIVGVEDCLTLAVYIPPAPIAAGKRPVVVYIHGGFLMSGGVAGDAQKLNHLVRRADCVLVSIQYRLHLFGFFQPPLSSEVPANRGLRDQLMALSWVQRNIASFGGDPNAVTLLGHSAGARSVVALEQSPLGTRLFQRAVALSPGFLPSMFTADISEVERTSGQRCLNATGCTSLQCLRNLQPEELMQMCRFYQSPEAFVNVPGSYFSGYDGEVLTAPVQSMYCSGADKPLRDRPMILGSVTREWNVFSLTMNPANVTSAFLQEFSDDASHQGGNASYLQCARSSLLADIEPRPCPLGVFGCPFTSPPLMQAATDLYSAGASFSLGPGGGPRYRFLMDTEEAGSLCSSCHGADMDLMYGLRSAFYVGLLYPQEKLNRMTTIFMEYLASFIRTGRPTATDGPEWEIVDRTGEQDTYGTPLMLFNLSAPALAASHVLGPRRTEAQESLANIFCQRPPAIAC